MKMNNQDGQSTIEFIFTFIFGVSIILMIFNSAMNYTTGYLVHYATFMASRVYLTADKNIGSIGNVSPSLSGSEEKARETFQNYSLGIFKIPDSGFNINQAGNIPIENYLTVGAYTVFDIPIDALGKVAGQGKLELVSESFLGKEPTRAECATRVCYALKQGQINCTQNDDITLYDDGC